MTEHTLDELLATHTELLGDARRNGAAQVMRRPRDDQPLAAHRAHGSQHPNLCPGPPRQGPPSIGATEDVVAALSAETLQHLFKNAETLGHQRHDVNMVGLVPLSRTTPA
jgi:hypothetical protein